MNIPGSPPLTAADFWALVKVFGNAEHKEYAARIEQAQAQLVDGSRAQVAEAKRLADLAGELDARKAAVEAADTELAGYRQAHAAEVETFRRLSDDTRKELATERQAIATRATALDQLQEKLRRQEAAIVEADRISQEAADQREKALDQREADIAAAEAVLNERKAKFLAAKEAFGV